MIAQFDGIKVGPLVAQVAVVAILFIAFGIGPARDRLRRRSHYTCPDHVRTGGYESCCACGGWAEGDPDRGRLCSEAKG